MSYLEGRKNLYSIISNQVIKHIKDIFSDNEKLKDYAKNGNISLEKDFSSDLQNSVFTGIPQNLVTSTTIYSDCGNDDNGIYCIDCLKKFDITDNDLSPNNYANNIEKINNIKNNQCSGACSCNISNVSLSSHLIFTTGVNINAADINTNEVYKGVKDALTSVDKNISRTESVNWLWGLCGLVGTVATAGIGAVAAGAGIAGAAANPEIGIEVEEKIKKVISNMSAMYSQTINQLITNSQNLVVKGTGIKVHNISIKSLNDIVLSASISDCRGGDCIMASLNSITSDFISEIQKDISFQIKDMFKYAFKQNMNLIFAGGIFITVTMLLWFFLLFKKATSPK